ncbi:hypothetical protein IMCC1989_14 [gamma proteobacterium IMCC1989]|nr:hypothetical protein IMCC1989_14 [gamma proteobacterium IMCC1989]
MATGAKKALSRKILVVDALTAESLPPITPAIAKADALSAITRVSSFNVAS